MIKLIAIDMDGTILGDSREVTVENAKAVKEAQRLGITVVIATGRDQVEASLPLKAAEIICPIISVNGAESRDKDGKLLSSYPLSKEKARSIFDILYSEEVYFELYTNHGAVTNNYELGIQTVVDFLISAGSDDDIETMRQIAQERFDQGAIKIVESYESLLNDADFMFTKVLAFSRDDEKREAAKRRLEEHADLAISASAVDNIEITNIQAQKGLAVQAWAESLGITMDEVAVIGDSLNDVSMFEVAGCRVAMGNAEPELKKLATWITKTNEEDGVAFAIRNILAEHK
jgi:Cof subfamily protein (haloacid dehalogenase superfamily)